MAGGEDGAGLRKRKGGMADGGVRDEVGVISEEDEAEDISVEGWYVRDWGGVECDADGCMQRVE